MSTKSSKSRKNRPKISQFVDQKRQKSGKITKKEKKLKKKHEAKIFQFIYQNRQKIVSKKGQNGEKIEKITQFIDQNRQKLS